MDYSLASEVASLDQAKQYHVDSIKEMLLDCGIWLDRSRHEVLAMGLIVREILLRNLYFAEGEPDQGMQALKNTYDIISDFLDTYENAVTKEAVRNEAMGGCLYFLDYYPSEFLGEMV